MDADGDLWFDTMAARGCEASTRPVATAGSGLLVVAADVEVVDRALAERGLRRRRYLALPVLEVATDDGDAAGLGVEIAALPGVLSVVPPLEALDASRTFAVGIDWLLATARVQHAGPGPDAIGGTDGPQGYPVLVEHPDGRWIELDPGRRWPAPPALLPVINLSVGPRSISYPAVLNDLVQVATLAASSEMLVVVAAGNCGGLGEGTMSAWATQPWVLAVGATDDEAGTRLAEYSSRGVAADPGSGPDLVALGRSGLDPEVQGTSFAAPRVTGLARVVAAATWVLRREVAIARGARPHGIPAVGAGFVDSFGAEIWSPVSGQHDPVALPVEGAVTSAVVAAVEAVAAAGGTLDVRGDPALLRRTLIESARPVPGCGPHEVGAGFVDLDLVLERLGRYTAADLARDHGSVALPAGRQADLAGLAVLDPEVLRRLADVVVATGPQWRYDYRSGRAAIAGHVDDVAGLDAGERVRGRPVPAPRLAAAR